MPKACAAIQRDLDRLMKWAKRNLKKFSKWKCKVQLLGRNNASVSWDQLAGIWLGRKRNGVMVTLKLAVTQQCTFASKTSSLLGR